MDPERGRPPRRYRLVVSGVRRRSASPVPSSISATAISPPIARPVTGRPPPPAEPAHALLAADPPGPAPPLLPAVPPPPPPAPPFAAPLPDPCAAHSAVAFTIPSVRSPDVA